MVAVVVVGLRWRKKRGSVSDTHTERVSERERNSVRPRPTKRVILRRTTDTRTGQQGALSPALRVALLLSDGSFCSSSSSSTPTGASASYALIYLRVPFVLRAHTFGEMCVPVRIVNRCCFFFGCLLQTCFLFLVGGGVRGVRVVSQTSSASKLLGQRREVEEGGRATLS